MGVLEEIKVQIGNCELEYNTSLRMTSHQNLATDYLKINLIICPHHLETSWSHYQYSDEVLTKKN